MAEILELSAVSANGLLVYYKSKSYHAFLMYEVCFVSQAWQKACGDGWERSFCEKNFLSQATMEIIIKMRTQLLGQLRAIGTPTTLQEPIRAWFQL